MKRLMFLTVMIVMVALFGCGGGGGGQSVSNTVNGVATKGPLNAAEVTVYSLKPNGKANAIIGTGVTAADNSGKFSVTLTSQPSGFVLIGVSNGNYTGEFDGKSVTGNTDMYAIVDATQATSSQVSVTPLSDMVAQRAQTLVQGGKSIADALSQAQQELQTLFSLTSPPESTVPSFNSADIGKESYKMGMVLASIDTFSHQASPTDADRVKDSLSADFADGKLDGKNASGPVTYGTLTNVDANSLKAMMFTATQTSITAVANGVSPSSIQTWANANSSQAASVVSVAPGFSCKTGQLVTDKSGSSVCWDGTKATDGSSVIGTYNVCTINNAIVSSISQCPATVGHYSCGTGLQLVKDQSGYQTCWDGTKAANGTSVIGTYTVCAANNAIVTSALLCPVNVASYTCGTGRQLVKDSAGNPTCWDGTRAADGTPIIGRYTACLDNVTKVPAGTACPQSGGIVRVVIPISSTTDPLYHAPLVDVSKNSTTTAQFTPPVAAAGPQKSSTTQAQYTPPTPAVVNQASAIKPITSAVLSAIRSSDTSSSLPSYVTPPSGGLNQAQIDAYGMMNHAIITNWYAR